MTTYDSKQLYVTLVDHFSGTDMRDTQNPLSDNEDKDIAELYDIFDAGGDDMGVTKFKVKNEEELRELLVFLDGRLPQLAKY